MIELSSVLHIYQISIFSRFKTLTQFYKQFINYERTIFETMIDKRIESRKDINFQ